MAFLNSNMAREYSWCFINWRPLERNRSRRASAEPAQAANSKNRVKAQQIKHTRFINSSSCMWCGPGRLSGAPARQYGSDRFQNDGAIEQQGHVFQVKQVILKLAVGILYGRAVRVPHLGPSGQARPRRITFVVVRDFLAKHVHKDRPLPPGSDRAHIAA